MAGNGRRYTGEQFNTIQKEAEAGPTVLEVLRRHPMSANGYYRWKVKFARTDSELWTVP